MTVISPSLNSPVVKKVVWGKNHCQNPKIFWLILNLLLFFSLLITIGLLVFQNIWNLNIRLEIQKLEKQQISLEEKNAELKNQWENLKNFSNFQKIIEENNLVLVEQPHYLTIEKKTSPLGLKSSYEKNY